MAQPPPDLLGRLAVHYQLISMQQLTAATQEQSRAPHKKLGAILVELGFIDEARLAQLVEAQRLYLAQQQQAQQTAQAAAVVARSSPPPAPPPPPPPPGANERVWRLTSR